MSSGSDAPTRDDEQPEPLSFTLVIVSPSVGVTSSLILPLLPATTTVKQLKAKIRDLLPSKPADDSQRLIHRGRMLGRETETMLEIFGKETLCSPESQTLHLVLRPTEGPPGQPPIVDSVPRPPIPSTNPLSQPQIRPQSTPAIGVHGMHAQQPLPGFQHVQQHQMLHQAEQYHSFMSHRLQQLQRETQRLQQEMGIIEQRFRGQPGMPNLLNVGPGMVVVNPLGAPPGPFQLPHLTMRPPPGVPSVQNLIAQQHQDRAANGRHENGGNSTPGAAPRVSLPGRASPNSHRPDHTTTYTREGVGQNGERWQMTVNETTTTLPITQTHHHVPYANSSDVQAVLRYADRSASQNIQATLNGMQGSASNPQPSLAPGSSNVQTPTATTQPEGLGSVVTSATTNSSPSTSTVSSQFLGVNAGGPTAQHPPSNSEALVYILSSPQGPRALLVTNSENYFTPRQHARRNRHDATLAAQVQGAATLIGLSEYRNRAARGGRNNRHQNGAQAQQMNAGAPRANAGGRGLAGNIGPVLWLIIRLVGFVWFFTSGNTSWTRWFMVSSLAIIVFIVNTGLFNGAAEHIWGPIRRHLEALIPLAGPDANIPERIAGPPAGNAGNQDTPRGVQAEPTPAEVAARLLQERRQANGGWLMAQVRRVEHALLLFMASLVPGVGERHIAAREAEAAERQARIDAAAAAETEAETAPEPEVGENAETGTGENGAQHPLDEEQAVIPPLGEV